MIRGLTFYQPLASFVATGDKRIETRSWPTQYRDVVAIHAASNEPHEWRAKYYSRQPYVDLLQREFGRPFVRSRIPRGSIVALAMIDSCISTSNTIGMRQMFARYSQDETIERALGDYRIDRYAWGLHHIFKLPEPVKCAGSRKLWHLDDDVREQCLRHVERAIARLDETHLTPGRDTLLALHLTITKPEHTPHGTLTPRLAL